MEGRFKKLEDKMRKHLDDMGEFDLYTEDGVLDYFEYQGKLEMDITWYGDGDDPWYEIQLYSPIQTAQMFLAEDYVEHYNADTLDDLPTWEQDVRFALNLGEFELDPEDGVSFFEMTKTYITFGEWETIEVKGEQNETEII